ncbi:Heat shock 70 kDa protein 4L, partial [Orchesella cincta]
MSVIGIDFGINSSFVAVAKAGSVQIIDHDHCLRATPSNVTFGERQRVIGVEAKTGGVNNLQSTVFGFKRFLGRRFEHTQHLKRVPFESVKTKNGGVGIKVKYLGHEDIYFPEQITAMLFTKLKETAEDSLQTKVQECVISVPSYFTDAERRALLDAAHIAGLHPLRLLNDTTAAALTYAISKHDLPLSNSPPRNVVIVDCGLSAIQVCFCAFNKGKLKVLSCYSDVGLGGQEFDAAFGRYLFNQFPPKYNLKGIINDRRGFCMRLLAEAEMLKKKISETASELPLKIDCLIGETGVVKNTISRAAFENICSSLLNDMEMFLRKCLTDSNLGVTDIHSVELVGGSSRIPALRLLIEKVFRKNPINDNESRRGRGYWMCSTMHNSVSKIWNYQIKDIQPFPIKLVWEQSIGKIETLIIFPKFYSVPSVSTTRFTCPSSTFSLVSGFSGSFSLDLKHHNCKPCMFNLTAKLDIHGIFSIESVTIIEEVENWKGNESNSSSSKKEQWRVLKDVMVKWKSFGLSRDEIDEKIKKEVMSMAAADRNEKERRVCQKALKNGLLESQEKLKHELGDVAVDHGIKQRLLEYLTDLENWLNNDGLEETKEVYIKLLQQVQEEPSKIRAAWCDLAATLKTARDCVYERPLNFPDSKEVYKEVEKVENSVAETERWLAAQFQGKCFKNLQKHHRILPKPLSQQIQDQRAILQEKNIVNNLKSYVAGNYVN